MLEFHEKWRAKNEYMDSYLSMIPFSMILSLLYLYDPPQILYRPHLVTSFFYLVMNKARTALLLFIWS